MKNCIILILTLFCITSIHGQKKDYKSTSKAIYGLYSKKGWPSSLIKSTDGALQMKGNTIMASKDYVFSNHEEGYILHKRDRLPKFTKEDQSDIIENHPDFYVVMFCMGCGDVSGCLIGWMDGKPLCTGCSGGTCIKDFLIVLKETVQEVTTPDGGF